MVLRNSADSYDYKTIDIKYRYPKNIKLSLIFCHL